jgi:hypothetical protein
MTARLKSINFVWISLIVLIYMAAAGIRLFDLTDPPLDFHPPRQFHSATLARGFYAQMSPPATIPDQQLAVMTAKSELWIEPPILEGLVALTYRIAGQDSLWIARLYSIFFWLLGGIPLFKLVRTISSRAGSLASLAYYLLLPYSVIASRSFQPDPLMICCTLFAAWAFLSWLKEPGWRLTVLAGMTAGLAILIKQVAIFPLAGFFGVLLVAQWGFKRSIRDVKTWVMLLLAITPVLAYNLYGLWIDGFLKSQFAMRFFPEMWTTAGFYLNWLAQINITVSLAAFLAAICGLVLAVCHPLGLGLFGWLAGYILYGFIFSHHIATHDYYQLPLIPLVALGLAPLADLIYNQMSSPLYQFRAKVAVIALFSFACLYGIYEVRNELKKVDYRNEPVIWQTLGQRVDHKSTAVIGLFSDYGARLNYWAFLVPKSWPGQDDPDYNTIMSQPDTATTYFESQTAGYSFFVVTDMAGLDRQPGLKDILSDRYPVFAQEQSFIIFDLRNPLPVTVDGNQ